MSNEPEQIPEKDAAGVPFDPARHTGKFYKKSGLWIYKSPGRPRKKASPDSTSTPPPSSTPTTDAPPSAPASTSNEPESPPSPPPPPPDFSDINRAAAKAAPEPEAGHVDGDAESDTPKPRPDAKASSASAARVVTKSVYLGTGALLKDTKAATPPAEEDKALTSLVEAFLEHRGFRAAGWLALFIATLAYLMRDDIVTAIKKRFGEDDKKPGPRNVTPPPPSPAPMPVKEEVKPQTPPVVAVPNPGYANPLA